MPLAKPPPGIWRPDALPAGCNLYLPLLEGTGPATADYSGAGNPGAFVGSPAWQSGPYGPMLGGFSTANYLKIDPAAPFLGVAYPWWIAVLALNDGTGDGVALSAGAASGSAVLSLRFNTNNVVGTLSYRLNNGTVVAAAEATGQTINGGFPHVVMGVSYSTSNHQLFLDGRPIAQAITSMGTFSVPRLTVGCQRQGSNSFGFPGSVVAALAGVGGVPDPSALAADLLSGTFAPVRRRRRAATFGAVVAAGGSGPAAAVGTASGSSTAAGVGASTAAASGSASGAATAPGVGSSLGIASGTAAGSSSAPGIGSSPAAAVGSASGTSSAAGVGSSAIDGSSTGTAAGTSTAAGVGASLATATGSAPGSSAASGIGSSLAAATGAAAGTSTAAGVGADDQITESFGMQGKPLPGTPIDWLHPLARGLVLCVPYWERAGNRPYNVVVGLANTSTNAANLGWAPGAFGTGRSSGPVGTAGGADVFATAPFSEAAFSVEVRATFRTFSGLTDYLVSAGHFNLTVNGGKPAAFFTGVTAAASATVIPGTPYHLIATFASGVAVTLYVNGSAVATATPGSSATVLNSVVALNQSLGATHQPDAVAGSMRIWNRVLSPSEVGQLYADPWGTFAAPRRSTLAAAPPPVTTIGRPLRWFPGLNRR